MPEHPLLQKFGQLFAESVRDRAIQNNDILISNALNNKGINRGFKSFLDSLDDQQRHDLRRIMIAFVDGTLHDLLFMFEEYDHIHIALDGDDDYVADIREITSGDLQGYIFIWAEEYSKEPLSHDTL